MWAIGGSDGTWADVSAQLTKRFRVIAPRNRCERLGAENETSKARKALRSTNSGMFDPEIMRESSARVNDTDADFLSTCRKVRENKPMIGAHCWLVCC